LAKLAGYSPFQSLQLKWFNEITRSAILGNNLFARPFISIKPRVEDDRRSEFIARRNSRTQLESAEPVHHELSDYHIGL
jgi:hypothetical protein